MATSASKKTAKGAAKDESTRLAWRAAPVAERPVLRPCTVCGSMVPSSQVTYDDVFGFV